MTNITKISIFIALGAIIFGLFTFTPMVMDRLEGSALAPIAAFAFGGDPGECGGCDPDPDPGGGNDPDGNDPDPASCISLTASPNQVPYGGGNTTLTWKSAYGGAASINNGVGSVPVNGSKAVHVTSNTTFVITIVGGGGDDTCATTVTVAPPPVASCDSFTANKTSLPYGGGDVKLTWNTTNAKAVYLTSNGKVSEDGVNFNVHVTATKTYILDVIGHTGNKQCSVTITVAPPTPVASCDSFTANPTSLPYGGGTTKLTWNTTNANSVSISGIGSVSADGMQNVSVTGTKTFTLTAYGTSGNDTCEATVTVESQSVATCDSFTASPNVLPYGGGTVSLAWNTTNANSVSISGIGNVSADGTQNVSVNTSKTFTLTAYGTNGNSTCTATVTVQPPKVASCDSFTANPTVLPYGGGITKLTWNTTNASSVYISGVGNVTADGSKNVSVTATKTFTLTAYGTNGNDTCAATVTVTPKKVATCDSFTVNPTVLPYGGGITKLTWDTTNATSVYISSIGNVTADGSKNVSVTATETFTLTAYGTNGNDTCTATVYVKPPVVASCDLFTANPTVVPYGGGNVTLNWDTTNATAVYINNGIGNVTADGSKTVFVSTNITYVLTAYGTNGNDTCSTTITVSDPGFPSCDSFSASPNVLPYGGGSSVLTWNTTNANSVSIDNGIGNVAADGSKTVTVNDDITYTLTVTNARGSVTCEAPIAVQDKVVATCDSFTGIPTSLPYGGGSVVLAWETTNANSVSIDNGIGPVSVDGTKTVNVTSNKTFTLTALGTNGNDTCYVTITVNEPNAPSCDSFTGTPTSLPYGGGNVTLDWETTNANSVSIDNGVGVVAADGSTVVAVTGTITYTLTATGDSSSVTCPVTITVAQEEVATCDSFTGNPTTLPYGGGNVTLAWETTNANSVSIDNGVGAVAVDGTAVVSVTDDITYTLTALGTNGNDTCEVVIDVQDPEVATCNAFTANPTSLPSGGGNVTLTWVTTNANSVSIDNGVGTVASNGSKIVNVTNNTTFTLTADGTNDDDTCEVAVVVANDISCDSFTISDSSVRTNDEVTLTWETTGVTSVSIDNGVGTDLSPDGSKAVTASADATYTLTLTDGNTTKTCDVSVDVTRSGGGGGSSTPRCDLDISDDKVDAGDEVTLTWDTSGAEDVTIEDNHGNVIMTTEKYLSSKKSRYYDGKIDVTVDEDTTYTLTAEKGSRDRECEVEVEVEDGGVLVLTERHQPLVAGIALTQLPYTGFDAGPALTFIFYGLLTLWALFVAYILIIKEDSILGFSLRTRGENLVESDEESEYKKKVQMLAAKYSHEARVRW